MCHDKLIYPIYNNIYGLFINEMNIYSPHIETTDL